MTLADVNGDHRPDVIVANRSSNAANPRPSFVCLSDGHGAFPTCRPLPTQSATIIVATDLDGDGLIDLFVPHRDGGQSLIFWNDGSGTFAAAPSLVGGAKSNVRAAVAADINGDGVIDLVVGDEQTGLFYLLGVGHRAFAAPVKFGIDKSAPYSIVITDMNRDKLPDIVVGNFEAPGVVYFNLGSGKTPTFSGTLWNDGKGATYGVAVGDLNGDGWSDIVGARSDAPNGIWFNRPVRKP